MSYILKRDYDHIIRAEVRQMVQGNNDYTLNAAEVTAIEIASGYLRQRYDVAKIFADIPSTLQLINLSTPIVENDYCHDANDNIYKALVDEANPAQLTDTDQWTLSDPRNKALLLWVIDICVYNIHSNLAPQNIPQLRQNRYDDAMKCLREIQKETITPDLPLLVTDDVEATSGTYTFSPDTKATTKW
jgi:hypothetical protein